MQSVRVVCLASPNKKKTIARQLLASSGHHPKVKYPSGIMADTPSNVFTKVNHRTIFSSYFFCYFFCLRASIWICTCGCLFLIFFLLCDHWNKTPLALLARSYVKVKGQYGVQRITTNIICCNLISLTNTWSPVGRFFFFVVVVLKMTERDEWRCGENRRTRHKKINK